MHFLLNRLPDRLRQRDTGWHSPYPAGSSSEGNVDHGTPGIGAASYSLINPRKMTPIACVLVMMAIWAALYVVAPLEPYGAPTLYPYLLLGASFAALLLGFCMFEPRRLPAPALDREEFRASLVQLYKVSYALGFLGIAFRAIDWIAFRGLSISLDIADNLEKVKEGGSNPFSTIAIFLIPLTIAPYIFHAVARRNGMRVGRPWLAIAPAIVWPMLAVMAGSRSTIFMQVGMIVIARVLILPSFNRRAALAVFVLFIVLVHAAGFIFIQRIEGFGVSIDRVARFSVFTHLIPSTPDYYHTMAGLDDPWRQVFFIDVMMMQYFMHGVPEFTYLVDHFTKENAWGSYTFTAVVRIYSIIAGTAYDPDAIVNMTPRQGVYTTIFGPFYVDFGPLIPFVGFLIGCLVSWVRNRVLRGDVAALPFYVALIMQVVAAVIVNAIVSAYGIFYDLAFLGFWIGCLALGRRGVRSIKFRFASPGSART